MFGLKKKEKRPDTEIQKLLKGFRAAYIAGLLMAVILLFVKMKHQQPWTDVFAVLTAMVTGQSLYAWFRDRTKKDKLMYVGVYLFFTAILVTAYYFDISK